MHYEIRIRELSTGQWYWRVMNVATTGRALAASGWEATAQAAFNAAAAARDALLAADVAAA